MIKPVAKGIPDKKAAFAIASDCKRAAGFKKQKSFPGCSHFIQFCALYYALSKHARTFCEGHSPASQAARADAWVLSVVSAPVILNTGAAGYGSQRNAQAGTTYAADGYINIACGNRGKQDTVTDEAGNTAYTGDAPSCLADQKAAARTRPCSRPPRTIPISTTIRSLRALSACIATRTAVTPPPSPSAARRSSCPTARGAASRIPRSLHGAHQRAESPVVSR